MNSEDTDRRCERCGSVVQVDLLGGMCVRCLAAASFAGPGEQGRTVGEYELLEELGRGGMGVVYVARQHGLDRLVAVKMLLAGTHAGHEADERLLHEARSAARLRHPNIVSIHQVGRHDGHPFYSMDLVVGADLACQLEARALSPRQAARIVAKAARAVQHAHEQGILHRDLKPANVLIDEAGEPHITDFGLVTTLDGRSGLTRTGEVLGSPGFMAPEQLRGKAEVASDVYGLGAILYFALTRRPPYVAAELVELIAAVQKGDLVVPRRLDPSIPIDLDTIVVRALAAEPSARYASAAELADDLERWLAGVPIRARKLSAAEKAWRWARNHRTIAVSAAVVAVSLIAGAVGVTYQWTRAERAANQTALLLYSADLKVASDALLSGDLGQARSTLQGTPKALRDVGFGLLWPRVAGDVDGMIGAADWTVTWLACSHDGHTVASTSQSDVVHLWDAISGMRMHSFPGTEEGWWAQFTSDGRYLFTGDSRSIKAWDLRTHALVKEFAGSSAQLSSDGRTLYSCLGHRFPFEGQPGAVIAWDVDTGAAKFKLEVDARVLGLSRDNRWLAMSDGHTWIALVDAETGAEQVRWKSEGELWTLIFTPDGRSVIAAGWSRAVRIWDITALPARAHNLEHPWVVWSAALSPDGRRLASVSSDRQVYVWDTSNWRKLRELRGHYDEVWSVTWLDNERLVSAGRDPRILRWNTSRESQSSFIKHDSTSYQIVWLDDDLVVTERNRGNQTGAAVRHVRESEDRHFFPGEIPLAYDDRHRVLWLSRESHILVARPLGDLEAGREVLWKLEGSEVLREHPRVQVLAGVAWAPLTDGSVVFHRLADGTRVQKLPGLNLPDMWATALSPNADIFVWAAESPRLFVSDMKTGAHRELHGHRYQVSAMEFARHGRWFVTGGRDGRLILWDSRNPADMRQLGQHTASVGRMALSRDDRLLLSHEVGQGVRLWHTETLREVGFLPARDEGWENWIGLSPDERWFGVRRTAGDLMVYPIAPADAPERLEPSG